jgi:hypothetical protein
MIADLTRDAIRGWTQREGKSGGYQQRGAANRRPSRWPRSPSVLVFDCETSVDDAQSLNLVVFRLCRWDGSGRLVTLSEGLAHGDDLPGRDPEGLSELRRYAADQHLSLTSCALFNERIFYPMACDARALIVCYNSPFDISRLARDWGSARKTMRGGFSFRLVEWVGGEGEVKEHQYRTRVRIKHLDSKKSFMRLARLKQPSPNDLIPEDSIDGQPDEHYVFPGHLLDLKTPVWALTNRAHSLKTAAEAFGTAHQKSVVEAHGRITREYIDYARNDVLVTADLLEKVREEYDKHPINLPITQAVSPASLAKAYLDAMGVQTILRRQPDLSPEVLGVGTAALDGGRAEVRIRWEVLPVVLLDAVSMYPSVNCLLNTWDFIAAERIEWERGREVATSLVELARSPNLPELLLEPERWRLLTTFVQIRPEGFFHPTRYHYDETGAYELGFNPHTADGPRWLTARRLPRRCSSLRRGASGNPRRSRPSSRRTAIWTQVDQAPRRRAHRPARGRPI